MDVLMPQLGETVTEGTIATWHKRAGEHVEADEIVCDVETDKVSMEIPSPGAGTIKSILVEEGRTVDVGTVLAIIESAEAGSGGVEPASVAAPAPSVTASPPAQAAAPAGRPVNAVGRDGRIRLSPAVRRLVAEHDIDVQTLEGTGRNGRVTRRDVLGLINRAKAPPSRPPEGARPAPTEPGVQHFNRIRRLTAEHMVRSKATSPHVLQAVEVDFGRVERTRAGVREAWRAEHGYSLTFLPFVAKAVCDALAEFPHLNSSVKDNGLLLHPHVNLAIAVDLGAQGLVAPVIRSADRLSLADLAEAIHDAAQRARNDRLAADDLSGGTYTLSNSGTFGTLITAPIINQPQVAILSIDGVRKRPVVIERPEGDAIAIRPVGILAQSFDHRAVDGAYSAAFLAEVRKLLERTDWNAEV
jgi:pyruvate dehydrogenase E2 component (dihydrolipoamide acetyltransferase)